MPTYKDGDRVTVAVTYPPGHRRVPTYIRGKTGEIERYCGTFANPEELAYGRNGLPKSLSGRFIVCASSKRMFGPTMTVLRETVSTSKFRNTGCRQLDGGAIDGRS